jgi:hypothetical protein
MLMMRLSKIVLIMLAALLLQACSAVRLAYNQAPDLTYWWLDGYFDFNETQTPRVRDEIARVFAWHRANELPKVAALLVRTQQLMPGEITPQQSCELFAEVRGLIESTTAYTLPTMAEFAQTLTPAQLEHLQRKYAKNRDEFQRDWAATNKPGSAEEQLKNRLKRSVDRSEMLYGRLEEAQLAAVRKAVSVSPFDPELALREMQRRQNDSLSLLKDLSQSKPGNTSAQSALQSLIARNWQSPDLNYRTYSQRMVQQGCESFAAIHASTTAAQRQRAVQVLKGYEGDVRALIAQKS